MRCDYCNGELSYPGEVHDILECGSVLRKRSRKLTTAYQELETAVRDLYYSDGDLNKVWVDAPTAVSWLERHIDQLRLENKILDGSHH